MHGEQYKQLNPCQVSAEFELPAINAASWVGLLGFHIDVFVMGTCASHRVTADCTVA